MPHPKAPVWSQKRKDLYFMGKLLQGFAQAIADNPHMPENPWPMTLNGLNTYISEELGRMNAAEEW